MHAGPLKAMGTLLPLFTQTLVCGSLAASIYSIVIKEQKKKKKNKTSFTNSQLTVGVNHMCIVPLPSIKIDI